MQKSTKRLCVMFSVIFILITAGTGMFAIADDLDDDSTGGDYTGGGDDSTGGDYTGDDDDDNGIVIIDPGDLISNPEPSPPQPSETPEDTDDDDNNNSNNTENPNENDDDDDNNDNNGGITGESSEPVSTPRPVQTQSPRNTPSPDYDDDDNAAAVIIPRSSSSPTPRGTPRPRSSVDRPRATLKPAGEAENSETPESNFVEFARVDMQQNNKAANVFYMGILMIGAGSVGIFTLIGLFVRNRRTRDVNQGIFDEIEEAETRGRFYPAQTDDYYDDDDDEEGYDYPEDDPYAQYANQGEKAAPASSSIYTGDFEPVSSNQIVQTVEDAQEYSAYSAKSTAADSGFAKPSTGSSNYSTDEILREVLNTDSNK